MTGTLSYRPEETGGRQREKSLGTRHRRLDDRYRVLPWPEDCTVVCREHRNWRDNEWGRVLFTDESRFSLSSASHRILIWRERGSHNNPSNIIERDRLAGTISGSQSHRACMGFSRQRLAARTLPPVTIRELRLALQDEWAAMPQQLIDTLILSMGRRCETCLAVREDHIPY
ncbi:transposable element Tc1 transposase [Trichonephila clavipes]|uniref:Transposable element Tc1 transposase n=1 Tax=Trichonephila clavipes TaxID=2585209 RepID=A0A8X6SD79_TRICX|nr:transposable element Tc1 transposase [Trichonephila clavipes]